RDIGKELGTLAGTDLPAAARSFQMLSDEYNLTNAEQLILLDAMPDYKKALVEQANQLDVNVTGLSEAENAQALLSLAMGETPGAATAAEQALAAADAALEEVEAAAAEADEALQGTVQALADIAGTALAMGEA